MAPSIDINDYPAIKKHLDKYWDKLQKRQDKGVMPYNLRNCTYLQEFEKEKIVYPDIAPALTFVLDNDNFFMNNTCYMLNFGGYNKYVLFVLNSNVSNWYFKWISAQLGEAAVRHFNIYIEKLPIPQIPKSEQLPFEILVDSILFGKENNMETEASTFESVVDGMVFNLYFHDHMKERGIAVLELAEKDINEVMQDRDFEKLSDIQKEQVITELHNRWTDPNNEVVKRMAMFKEKSPDVLKVILEQIDRRHHKIRQINH